MARFLLIRFDQGGSRYRSYWDTLTQDYYVTQATPVGGVEVQINAGPTGPATPDEITNYFFCDGNDRISFNYDPDFPYAVQVRTANFPACVLPDCDIEIAQPVSVTGDTGAGDGTLTAVATSTAGGIEYSIDNGSNWQASGTFGGLIEGTYRVLARDASMCTASVLVSIPLTRPPFAVRWRSDCRAKDGTMIRIDIEQAGYVGAIELIDLTFLTYNLLSGNDPLTAAVKPTTIEAGLVAMYVDQFIDLFTDDPYRHKVKVYKDLTLFWAGYAVSQEYREEYRQAPFVIAMTATDGLGLLSNETYTFTDGSTVTGRDSILDCLLFALNKLDLQLPLFDAIEYLPLGAVEADGMIQQVTIRQEAFEQVSCRDVVERIVSALNGRLSLYDGRWNLTHWYQDRPILARRFSHTGTLLEDEITFYPQNGVGPWFATPILEMQPPVKTLEVVGQYQPDNVLYEGPQRSEFNGQNFLWSGSATVTRVQDSEGVGIRIAGNATTIAGARFIERVIGQITTPVSGPPSLLRMELDYRVIADTLPPSTPPDTVVNSLRFSVQVAGYNLEYISITDEWIFDNSSPTIASVQVNPKPTYTTIELQAELPAGLVNEPVTLQFYQTVQLQYITQFTDFKAVKVEFLPEGQLPTEARVLLLRNTGRWTENQTADLWFLDGPTQANAENIFNGAMVFSGNPQNTWYRRGFTEGEAYQTMWALAQMRYSVLALRRISGGIGESPAPYDVVQSCGATNKYRVVSFNQDLILGFSNNIELLELKRGNNFFLGEEWIIVDDIEGPPIELPVDECQPYADFGWADPVYSQECPEPPAIIINPPVNETSGSTYSNYVRVVPYPDGLYMPRFAIGGVVLDVKPDLSLTTIGTTAIGNIAALNAAGDAVFINNRINGEIEILRIPANTKSLIQEFYQVPGGTPLNTQGLILHPDGNLYSMSYGASTAIPRQLIGYPGYVPTVIWTAGGPPNDYPARIDCMCVGLDDRVYAAGLSFNNFKIAIFTPDQVVDVAKVFPAIAATTIQAYSCTAAPNGKIYFACSDPKMVIVYDPVSDTATVITLSNLPATTSFRASISYAIDGNLYYCLQADGPNSDQMWVIDPATDTEIGQYALPTSLGNNYSDVRSWKDGNLYLAPLNGGALPQPVTKVTFNPSNSPVSDPNFVLDMTNFAPSNFNRFFNRC